MTDTEPSGIPREFEEADWLIVHLHGVEKGREAERAKIISVINDRIKVGVAFIQGADDHGVPPSASVLGGLVELRSLLRELEHLK